MVARFLVPTAMILLVVGLVVGPPLLHYRWTHNDARRLREVTAGRVYRSGQLTADGLADAVRRYGIRTVLNLQDEFPDPDMARGFFDSDTVPESELCQKLGVRYIWLAPDLVPRQQVPDERPAAIDKFLRLMDDEASYPVLIHCKAGLHRTGCMVAVYRMEYEGWSAQRAVQEMKDNGFGDWACTASNDYVEQYVLTYRPHVRRNDE